MAKVGKSKQPLTDEGKAMVKFWRDLKKCKPISPTLRKEKVKNDKS